MLSIQPYIKVLTPQRIVNYLLCKVSCVLRKESVTHRPCFVSIEPANFCQLRCPECPVGMRNQAVHNINDSKVQRLLAPALFAKLLEENARYMHTIIFYFQGEPLLNRDLPNLIRMAKEHHLYTYLSTNLQAITSEMAHALIASGIDRIVASIDGISEESYQTYRRGGTLKKALQGLRLLHEEKMAQHAHTIIEWQCLRLRSNEHEWNEIRKQYKALGADMLTFKTAQFYDFEHGNLLMPTNEKHSRYKKQPNDTYKLNRSPRTGCKRLYAGCVMDVQGNILPCCFDKSSKYVFGNLQTASLADIWNSEAAQNFRHRVSHSRSEIDICRNCAE